MTPELRDAIFSLELYKSSINEPSDWLPQGQKREILTALQELFVKLAFIDEHAISTQNLTKSFGWTGEEVIVQHDVQELSRVFFDCLERALQGTSYSDLVSNHIKGKYLNTTTCSQCKTDSCRLEDFADIGLRVKGLSSIEESLQDLTKEDLLEGSNQYHCDVCQCKVNAIRKTRIAKLPKLLNFSLNRFEYDMRTYERVKINSNFAYPLELNMEKYCESAGIYELFAVIIHGGGAHSGHYHAYIRDLIGQGNWQPGAFTQEPVNLPAKPKQQDKRQGRRKKNKKNRGNKKKDQKKEQKETKVEENFDNQEFCEDCADPSLLLNWYDFNDTVVTPIRSGKLKKQFGGSSETAYILIYRAKDLPPVIPPQIPGYWASAISSCNEDHKVARLIYEAQKNIIEVQVQTSDLFEFEDDNLVYIDKETNTLVQGISIQMEKTSLIEDLKNHLTINLIDDYPDLFNTHQIFLGQPLSNKCVHILRSLETMENESTLSKESISHKACFIILPKNNPKIEGILEYIGHECEPLTLNCNHAGEKFLISCNKGWTIERLKEKIRKRLQVDLDKIELKYRKSEGGDKKITYRDDESSLNDLKFYHTMTLNVEVKEEEIPMVELKKSEDGQDLVSVLLTDEIQPNNPIQHLVIKDWRVRDLIQEVKVVFKIESETPVRLRKLIDGKVICKEDVDSFLKNLPEFMEGGYRFQVERGEPPSFGFIVLKVAFEPSDTPKDIFVKETEKISDVKQRASEVLNFPPEQFKLYRTDWLREPISALKQENQTLFKVAVKDGDLLLVKSITTVVESETLRLQFFIHESPSPLDLKPVQDISFPEDTTLKSLKDQIHQIPDLNPLNKPFIRIREITKTMWPGKVYKEDNKSLKRLAISFGSNLLVEPLDIEDSNSFTGLHIFIGLRDSKARINQNIIESYFDAGACPNIDHLYKHILDLYKLQLEFSSITLARFKANSFEWEIMKDERLDEEKGKLIGVKANTTATGIFNLKKKPFFIKDGDFFSLKINDEENLNDDFGCVGDAEAREAYLKRRQTVGKDKKVKKAEKAIRIGDF